MSAFVNVPPALIADGGLSLQARAVYAVLAALAAEKGKRLGEEVELPPLERIAAACGCSENALRGYVRELREAAWVVVHRASKRRTQRYVIRPSPSTSNFEVLSTSDSEVLARARPRVTGGELETSNNYEEQDNNAGAPERAPPPLVKIAGRNAALDALCQATGVDEKSPRFQQAIVALSGRLDGRTGKVKEPGIRHLFWIECVRYAEEHDALDRLDAMYSEPEEWALALARRIEAKAARYMAVYPGAALSPNALRNHWLDLERVAVAAAGGMTAEQMERFEG